MPTFLHIRTNLTQSPCLWCGEMPIQRQVWWNGKPFWQTLPCNCHGERKVAQIRERHRPVHRR